MLDAGLARQGQRGVYDYFRGRVTWPIRDSTGRTLGFGARKLYDDDQIAAKYINTPDTQLYHKNQVLYGIDLAKQSIVKKRQAVIVEGYTDVMAMHLAGVDTAIATCGTAFGEEHAKIVRRLVKDDSLGAIQLVGPLKVDGRRSVRVSCSRLMAMRLGRRRRCMRSVLIRRFCRRRLWRWPSIISIRAICVSSRVMRRFVRWLPGRNRCMTL